MKNLLVLALLAVSANLLAQQLSQKDKDKAMAEYNKMLQDPKLKKMMDSMGVKLSSPQTINQQYDFASQHTTQAQKNAIMGIETLPTKDLARINALPKGLLPDAQFNSLLLKIKTAASAKISDQSRQVADQIEQTLKRQGKGAAELASAANGMWMKGFGEIGLELMGRAVAANPTDADNLNNFAVFLSSYGGEHLALPILQQLNHRYPGNSTILNNIGQAWFGLGDMGTSKKYLDSAIHFFGMHTEANYTEAVMDEASGNVAGAIQCLKNSLQNGYNPAKAARLNRLQKGLQYGDIAWNFPRKPDALGLEKLRSQRPEFYFDVQGALSLEPKWAAFRMACTMKMLSMRDELNKRSLKVADEVQKMVKTGKVPGGNRNPVNNFLSTKAREMLTLVNREEADFNQKMEAKARKLCDSITILNRQVALQLNAINDKFTQQRQTKDSADGNKYDRFEGDDRHATELLKQYNEKACQEAKKLVNAHYQRFNRILSDLSHEWVDRELNFTNDIVYYSLYASANDNEYQIAKLGAIASFINRIGQSPYTAPVDFFNGSSMFFAHGLYCKDPESKPGPMTLADYDELHCDNHITLKVPGVGVSHWDCNIETDTINLASVLDVKYRENLSNGKFNLHGELGYSKSVGSQTAGPLKAGASVGGGGFIDVNETGVTDGGAFVKGGASVGVSVDVPLGTGSDGKEDSQSVGKSGTVIGLEGRVGWNSGPSLSGKGVLSGVSIK